jgi:hypothetical protein
MAIQNELLFCMICGHKGRLQLNSHAQKLVPQYFDLRQSKTVQLLRDYGLRKTKVSSGKQQTMDILECLQCRSRFTQFTQNGSERLLKMPGETPS